MLKEKNLNGKRVIISRTDSIGDVVLTLPLAGMIKKLYPGCFVIFLGRSYTKSIVEACENIDSFVCYDEIKDSCVDKLRDANADVILHVFPSKEIAKASKKARIPLRIGTTNRLFHWGRCNKLVKFTRRRSELHESQLNMKLLLPFGFDEIPELDDIKDYYGLSKIKPLNAKFNSLLQSGAFNLILHPKSKGSAREWKTEYYYELIKILPADKFKIFITGTKEEGEMLDTGILSGFPNVINLTGKFTLEELMSFIASADGLIAASTGPLHIAAALGKYVIGIYPPIKPMHPGRWAPLGTNAHFICADHECDKCRKKSYCFCMDMVEPAQVRNKLLEIIP